MPSDSAPPSPSTPAVHDTCSDCPSVMCSDCIEPTPATEIHALGGGMIVAYCARCAETWRRYAHIVYSPHMAHLAGWPLPNS